VNLLEFAGVSERKVRSGWSGMQFSNARFSFFTLESGFLTAEKQTAAEMVAIPAGRSGFRLV
jgi:hypothetical protein